MRPTQCVGGLYLTIPDSLAPLSINNNNEKNFQAISNCGKQTRSSQVFRKVSGVFQPGFNGTKNSAVFEPRTGQFSRTWFFEAKAKDFKMCPRGRPRGLHLCFLYSKSFSMFFIIVNIPFTFITNKHRKKVELLTEYSTRILFSFLAN